MKRYIIRDSEAGNIIDSVECYSDAVKAVKEYEETDRDEGNYTPDFYEIYDTKNEVVMDNSERYTQIQQYADGNGLQLIETTSQANGYPSERRYALIGFDNIEQLRAAKDELGGWFYHLQRKSGWQLWYRRNQESMPRPYDLEPEDIGYLLMYTKAESDALIENELVFAIEGAKDIAEDEEDMATAGRIIENVLSVMKIYSNMRPDECLLLGEDWTGTGCFDTVAQNELHPLSYSYDSTDYSLGLVIY